MPTSFLLISTDGGGEAGGVGGGRAPQLWSYIFVEREVIALRYPFTDGYLSQSIRIHFVKNFRDLFVSNSLNVVSVIVHSCLFTFPTMFYV